MNTQLGIEEVIKKYKLPVSEVYQHKEGWKIITANGIRKIIDVEKISTSKSLLHYSYQDKTAVVKCYSSMDIEDGKTHHIDAMGEVSPDNNTFESYFVNTAEKRAEGRSVLQLIGLYSLGFRSEVEMDEMVKAVKILEKRKEQTASALSQTLSQITTPDKKKSKSLMSKAGVDLRVDENSKVVEGADQKPFDNAERYGQ